MSEKKDDPREVLSLLNSLGFVGITAQQLKAFMKDLKMHRKIKERERQQWKEETKKKILLKQQELYREVLQEHKMENAGYNNVTESTISSESSTFHNDSSYKVVTVKIRCIPKDKENTPEDEHEIGKRKKTAGSSRTHTSWAEEFRQNSLRHEDNGYNTSSSTSVDESRHRFDRSDYQSQNHSGDASTDSTKYISLEKPRRNREARSEQNLKQSNLQPRVSPTRARPSSSRQTVVRSESLKRSPSGEDRNNDSPTNPPPSRSSVQSRPKSFIRPWRLQPESHRSSTNTKSDPVALYQKYRDEWKHLALPGEENHARVRWAVREKMLGTDPNPRLDINEIEETNYDIDLPSSLDNKERRVHRRKSRRIRKTSVKDIYSIQRNSNPSSSSVRRDRFTSFKSVSESFLVESKSFKSRDTKKSENPRSVVSEIQKVEEIKIKIKHEIKSRSCVSTRNSDSREIRSGVRSAKQTLGRLVRKFMDKDLNSYIQSYKYMNKCSCVFETEDS